MDSATIVAAALDSKQLETSINDLVSMVAKKTKEMADNFTGEVKRMEDAIKNLGSIKIDSGGTANGGSTKRAAGFEKLQKSVNDASASLQKHQNELVTLKNVLGSAQEQENSFLQAKQNAANTISKENELLQRQEQELANLKSQQSSFVGTNQQTTASIDKQRESVANLKNEVKYWQSVVSQMQNGDKKLRFNSLWLGDTTSKQGHDILDVANKLYSIMQKLGMETEKGSASTSQAVRAAEELAKYYKISREEAEKLILSVQESPLARGKYTTHYDTRFGLDNLTMQQKTIDDFALRKELAQGKLTFETDNLTLANKRLEESEKAVASASSQRSQLDSQIAAKEKEIADTKGRIAVATKEQAEAEKNASQESQVRANIQSQIATKEKIISETRQQLTTATKALTDAEKQSVQNVAQQTVARDRQIKKNQEVAMTYDQMQAAFQRIAKDNGGLKDIRTFNKSELQSYIDLLRKLQAEYVRVNTQEGGGVKSDQIKRDMAELEKIIQGYQTILRNVEAINSRQGTIDVRKWTQDIGAVDDRYKKLVRWYTVLEKEDQRRIANEEKANQKRLAELDKEEKARQKMIESARKAEEKYQNAALKTAFNKIVDMPSNNIDQMRSKLERLQTILANIRELGILSPKDISNAETEIGKLRGNIQQIEKIEKERIAAERQFVIEQQKEIENLTTIEGRVKSLSQATKQYFAENKGAYWEMFTAYGKNFTIYNPEKSNRANGLSIEEQITNILKEEKTAREGVSQAAQQQNGATQNVAKAQKEESESIRKNFRDYDSLYQAIASVLRIRSENVRLQGVEISSINDLSNRLKELRSVYNQLGTQDRHSERGKELISKIQIIERQMDRARKELSRPIDLKSALGTSEKTLDDIAYKMQRLASYKMGLNIKDPNAMEEMRQVDSAINRLKKQYDDLMGKNNQMIASNNALGRSWNYMKNRLAFYFSVGASTQFVKSLIDIRGQYELLERSIGILIDSAQNGSRIFAELNSMAIKSPFTTMELGAAAKQLVAYDVAAKDVVDTTRRLADMAAAVGIPIERLTYALGQIKAYGYLNARDARMFANAGIPLVKELADRYTELEGRLVSTADVYDRIKKKAISYEDVMDTVNKMTDEGGKFFNFQEKAADTLKVRIANLTLAWNNMMNEMGKDNQGVLAGGLKMLKNVFEHWRDIYNLLLSIIATLGILKTAQIVVLTTTAMRIKENIALWTALEFAMRKSLGAAIVNNLKAIGSLIARFASPLFLTTAAITALGIAIGKVVFDYKDLIAANEAFNKSISDNAKENITSIEKFFEDYKKQFSNIGGLNNADQEKLWQRLQEEIEKTTKNAEEYVNILNDVERVSSRIRLGEDVLEQSKIMQRELQRLADSGTFNIGGGFANDSAAKDLQDYQKALNEIRQEYGSVNAAIEAHTMKSRKLMADYTTQRDEVRKELNDFISKLDNAYMPDILGQSNDVRIQMANVRSFAESLRDAFIATEEGSKIGTDGIAILNSEIDKWVTKQGIANNLIVNANGDFDEQRAKIEENKTAWEEFFRYISNKDKEYLDAAIKTNDLGSDEVRKIWDKAAEEMSKRSTTSYNLIQDQIAQLRNTPDIVINVVYKEQNRESADKQINEYQEKYMTPSYVTFNEPSKYIEERKRLTEVYGRFIKKEGESNVEWEKRLGQEYQDNIKNIESLNNMLKSSSIMSETDREAKENERKALEDYNKTLLEVGKNEGFNYDQFKKGGKGNKGGSKKDPVLDALKQEINLVEKLQGDYDKLTKSGASQEDALSTIRSAYGNTIKNINSQLNKFGLPEVASTLITGKDPNKALEHFKSTLDNLVKKGMLSLERSKEVEAVIQKFTLSAQTYNLDKITKGLNNELDRLKDEYELAVSLDADPELGNAFAEMMGINMETLPRTVEEYASQYTKYLNKFLNEKNTGLKLPHLNLTDDDLRSFKEMVEQQKLSEEAYNAIVAAVKDVSGKRKKEIDDAIKGWDKLIEKYGEYEAKINAIRNDVTKERAGFVNKFGSEDQKSAAIRLSTLIQAEQDPNEKQKLIEQLKALVDEVAGNDATRLKIKTAIDTFGLREEARVKFEEFQKTPEWITATGELSGMTNKAIGGLIKSLEKYKKTTKNLDPKQIKNINNALKNLYKEQRKGNPFGAIADMLDRANERMKDVEPEMESIMKDILAIEDEIGDGEATKEQIKKIEDLKEQWKSLSEVGKTSAQEWVASITSVYDAVKGAIQLFDDLAKAIGGKNASDIEKVFGILDKAIQGAQVGAAFGTYGAAIGAAVGGLAAGIKTYSDELSGNKAISDSIKEQEQLVVRLTNQYKVLEDAIENSYAIERYGAQRAALANKELQLSAIKRQLALEESRKSKNKDEEKIESLKGQIVDLELEIKNGINEIANDMLGISSVGDAAENLVSSMIQAFRSGEDYMKSYSDAFSDMIDNMVTKSIVSEVIGKRIEEIFAQVKEISNTRADKTMFSAIDVTGGEMQRLAGSYERTFEDWAKTLESWIANPNISQEDKTQYERWLENLRNLYTQAITPTVDDVQGIREKRDEWQSEVKEIFDAYMDAFGITFGQDKEGTNLSALQAGIQGITEDTAGALEAYMNGVSQQVYLHSDLLTQIRDAIVGFSFDVQVATMSQILLQLQSSYTVQMSIQGILEGWSSPNGMAVRVEMQ